MAETTEGLKKPSAAEAGREEAQRGGGPPAVAHEEKWQRKACGGLKNTILSKSDT